MRYVIACLVLACFVTSADAGFRERRAARLEARQQSKYPAIKAVAQVVTAPVKAVRTIVCNGKTCTVK